MNALYRYLRENRIRQADFAARIGVTQGTISKLCRCGAVIRSDMMLRIERETGGAVPANSWIAESAPRARAAAAPSPEAA